MIDVTDHEGRLSFAELADLLPRDHAGRKIRVATLTRYAIKGRGGVKLEATKIGRTWYTTREAANRFFALRGRATSASSPAPSPALARATAKAEAMGL